MKYPFRKAAALLLSALVLFSVFSCSGADGEQSHTLTEQSGDTSVPDGAEESMWDIPDGIVYENGILKAENGNDIFVRTKEELGSVYTLDLSFTFDSQNSRARIYFDCTFEGDTPVRGYVLTADCAGSSLSLSVLSGAQLTQSAYHPAVIVKGSPFRIVISRSRGSVSVYCPQQTGDELLPLISIAASPYPGFAAVSFCSSRNVSSSLPVILDSAAGLPEGVTYSNPLRGSIADPSVFLYDGVYYLASTGSFECFGSTDLVSYQSIGLIADKNTLYGHKYFGGPTLFEDGGIFYMFYTTYADGSDSELCICVATSSSVTGPYTQTKQTMLGDTFRSGSAGTFIFRDPADGQTYIFWYTTEKEYGNLIYGARISFSDGIAAADASSKTRLLTAGEKWEMKNENGYSGRICERPNVYYHNGYYYLFYAGSHWATSYGEGYAVSVSPLGAYEKYSGNPVLSETSSVSGPGCTWIVPSPDGSELFVLYHCHYSSEKLSPRALCMDRLIFTGNPDGGADIAVICGPTVTAQCVPAG